MAVWQIMKDGKPTNDPLFDDGNLPSSGDDGFTTAAINAKVAQLGGGRNGFNYVGPSQQ